MRREGEPMTHDPLLVYVLLFTAILFGFSGGWLARGRKPRKRWPDGTATRHHPSPLAVFNWDAVKERHRHG
jgi:hypothetical protein